MDHVFDTSIYRDCSCGWKAQSGSWANMSCELWSRHAGAFRRAALVEAARLQ